MIGLIFGVIAGLKLGRKIYIMEQIIENQERIIEINEAILVDHEFNKIVDNFDY